MKKIISITLCAVMLFSSIASFNVSAFEVDRSISIQSNDLASLYRNFYNYWYGTGCIRPFGDCSCLRLYKLIDEAPKVFGDPNATDEQIQKMYYDMWDQANNITVEPEYAYYTYENAVKEENYNNWYSEEDWNRFTEKRENLKNKIYKYYGIYRYDNGYVKLTYIGPAPLEEVAEYAVSDAFYEMLKVYNQMTNEYQLTGDLNRDGKADIQDVTLIQKYIAEQEKLTGAQKMLAGGRRYENVSVKEATEIQKRIVEDESAVIVDNIFIPKDGCNESYERRMERTFNYNICPRKYDTPLEFANGFYDTQYAEFEMGYYNLVISKR